VIGGVNEKIEGFFDICSARGLSTEHGVLIPHNNVENLLLRHDVKKVVAAGHFSIYPISHIDEAIQLLTGIPAGEPDTDGNYPATSINGKVQARLQEFAELRRNFARGDKEER
jgi:predicted ATP-dependent protease